MSCDDAGQGELWPSDLVARATDPDTSHAALVQFNITDRRMGILRQVARLGWATSFDCSAALGVPVQNLSNQFKPLEEHGYLRRHGTTEPIPGRGARTRWLLTTKAHRLLYKAARP